MVKYRAMNQKIFLVFCLLFCSCRQNISCEQKYKAFFQSVEKVSVDQFLGLTITYRSTSEGKKNVRSIQFNDQNKNRFSIPSFERNYTPERLRDWMPQIEKFASQYEVERDSAIVFAKYFSKKIINSFEILDVREINSQLHLGEFIEFKIDDDCSIYYLKPGGALNTDFRLFFDEARMIKPGWYELNKWRTKPVLDHFMEDTVKFE